MGSIDDLMGGLSRAGLAGSITIEAIGVGDHGIGRHLCIWRPSTDIEASLPPGFRLEMIGLVGPGGTRRFVPAKGVEAFLLEASLGGLAVLGRLRDLEPQERFSYNAMRLIFQQAPRLREHLSRSFNREADLYGRDLEVDILPERLGLTPKSRGGRWSVVELLRQGRELLSGRGEVDLSPDMAIAEGLLAAAQLDPLDPASLTEAMGRGLVRMALFDLGHDVNPLTPEVKGMVTDRFLRLLGDHLGDDSLAFNDWFLESRDNLIRCIADQRRDGGPIPRDAVRRALLELVWDSFIYVGDCVALQMAAYARALPEPLTPADQRAFDAAYTGQSYLGGLPLVMLRERFVFLRGAILDLLEDPADPSRVGVLLRLLDFYATMTAKRREADRFAKRRGPKTRPAIAAIDHDASTDASGVVKQPFHLFDSIAEELRKARGIACPCGARGNWCATQVEGDECADPIVLQIDCESCGQSETMEVGRAEFAEIGSRLLHSAQ
jgi:hypothetical protein